MDCQCVLFLTEVCDNGIVSGMRTNQSGGVRGLARASVRDHVAAVALEIFDERGFDETTVDDIAAAVGMSPRTFFRYFPSKEDVVIGDPTPFGLVVRDAALARPASEGAWTVLRRALDPVADTGLDTEAGLRRMRVLVSAASLRARNVEKHNLWAELLEPVIAPRLSDDGGPYHARVLIHAALACLDVALAQWVRLNGTVSRADLLDTAFSTVAIADLTQARH